mgnify:FL=1
MINGAFRIQWAGKSRSLRSKDQPTMVVMPWFHASTRRAARCENVDMRVLQGGPVGRQERLTQFLR